MQTAPAIDSSSRSRLPKCLGEDGVEEPHAQSIDVAKRSGVIKVSSARRGILDATVMP